MNEILDLLLYLLIFQLNALICDLKPLYACAHGHVIDVKRAKTRIMFLWPCMWTFELIWPVRTASPIKTSSEIF